MAKVRVFHTGIMLFANFKTRALLPDLRCGTPNTTGGHDHSHVGQNHKHFLHRRDGNGQPGACCLDDEGHPLQAHFAHVRFPLDAVQTPLDKVPFLEFQAVDPLDGKLRWFGLVMLHRQAVTLEGSVPRRPTRDQLRKKIKAGFPTGTAPSTQNRNLYYWVSEPTRFTADTDLSIRSEFLDDDPANGIAGYFDSPFSRLEPYFGRERVNVWSFRPRLRGNKDHTQALAQVVVKHVDIGDTPTLYFRTFGTESDPDRKIEFDSRETVDLWVGNTTRATMMLRPNGFPRSPDHHFDYYYEYLCPPQATRPLPHLESRFSGPPEAGGSNCPPMDPPPPPPPPP